MDRLTLSRIDEDLDSQEVGALCFLCSDVINRKRLQGVTDAKELFLRLEERGLLDDPHFLSRLLQVIRRADLLSLLETNGNPPPEADAHPVLSGYRVLLYCVYEDLTQQNLDQMKFLLSGQLGRRQIESCKTALDVFLEMEKTGLLSPLNLDQLHEVLLGLDRGLAATVQQYMLGRPRPPGGTRPPAHLYAPVQAYDRSTHHVMPLCSGNTQQQQATPPSHISMDHQRVNAVLQPPQTALSVCETRPGDGGRSVFSDAQSLAAPPSSLDQKDYYALTHNPRGSCVVFNNEKFLGKELKDRAGTLQDEGSLRSVFGRLGFRMEVNNNLTADDMRLQIKELSRRSFVEDDALVVCVLSHGEKGCVFGTDEVGVSLRELTQPFTSGRAPTLAGKPKLFFIQACQGSDYQRGSVPCPPTPREEEGDKENRVEEDAGRTPGETVPTDADFLVGMATVQDCKSFRSTSTGSIYIQELCAQLMRSAQSPENDDILTVLTRVNRAVSKGVYLSYKQMPEPKYTLTKKLVLKCV
ncbi:caspase-8 isoform X2 [Antennarius striatus]|uniref:caspase-8 isoform X2 n=1 Tax=Antennarius striatus TaxID=241820 RepID=UPI0035B18B46